MSRSAWILSGSAPQDDLSRVVRASAGEHGEPAKHPLLRRLEQVVRPFDRRSERLLARIGVATGLEQVEPLREPREELLGREYDRARRRQLERKRKVVEASCRARRSRPRASTPEASGARPHEEELDAIVVCKRRNRIDVLTLELEPLSARNEDRRTRGVAEACDLCRDLGQEVLDVVDEHQRTLAREMRDDELGEIAARHALRP